MLLDRDDDILIVDKPYDLRVDGNDFDCTVEKFVRDIPHARPGSLKIPMDKFRLANQLDFATSGALVLTLNKTADRETSALFQVVIRTTTTTIYHYSSSSYSSD